MNGSEILLKYLNMMADPDITLPEIKSSKFYENELTLLAAHIAKDFDVTQFKQLTFQVHSNIFVLMKAKRYWEITLPYYNTEVINHYKKNPPLDLTSYAVEFHYHYYTELA